MVGRGDSTVVNPPVVVVEGGAAVDMNVWITVHRHERRAGEGMTRHLQALKERGGLAPRLEGMTPNIRSSGRGERKILGEGMTPHLQTPKERA